MTVETGITSPNCLMTGLTNDTRYYWTVVAVNSANVQSVVSNEVSAVPVASSVPVPSGPTPTMIWTTARNTVYQQEWTNYQATPSSPSDLGGQWMKQQVDSAANSGGPLSGFSVMAFMYQVTGDVTYAQSAYTRMLLECPLPVSDANFVREAFLRYVILYNWLYSGLTQAQRDDFLAHVNSFASYVLAHDLRLDDSDQTVGTYFGTVLLYLLTGSYNPTAVTLYNRAIVGGLDATAADRTTWRNAVKEYVTVLAAGGEWFESTEYNYGTTRLLMEGAEAVKTHTGIDHFPEVTAWMQEWALRDIYFQSPDLQQWYQWGDEENPRATRIWDRTWNLGTISGLVQGTTNGPYVQDRLRDMVTAYPLTTYSAIETAIMLQPGMMFVNPYATRGDSSGLPKSKYFSGQGFLFYHDGWASTDTMCGLHLLPVHPFCDHTPQFFGDVQLYRKGEWALTHPLSYSGPSTRSGAAVNGVTFYDYYNNAFEYRKVVAQQTSTSPAFAYLCGTQGGQIAGDGSYDPPQTWMQEHTRSMVYLPSSNKASDTIIVFDRFNQLNPQTQTGYSGGFSFYYANPPEAMTAVTTQPRREVVFHMPVNPTVSTEITWTTTGGQAAVLSTLLPSALTRTVVDENTLYAGTPIGPTERKFQVRLKEPTEAQWRVFLNVVTVHDSITRSVTLVEAADHGVQGVNVHRASLNDTVVLFNARQGADLLPHTLNGSLRSVYAAGNQAILDSVHLLQTGYTVPFTAATATTDLILCDLNPAKTWTINKDGGGATSLTVSSQGVATTTVSGSGAHSIVVVGS